MPLVRGQSLRQRLDRDGPLDVATASHIITDVCGALDHAQREGIVHRDMKPENILPSEQARGDPIINARSDQYSTACVLFELLTGQTPFQGPTSMAFLMQHMAQRPATVSSLRSDIPSNVEQAIARALEKQSGERFDSHHAAAQ